MTVKVPPDGVVRVKAGAEAASSKLAKIEASVVPMVKVVEAADGSAMLAPVPSVTVHPEKVWA